MSDNDKKIINLNLMSDDDKAQWNKLAYGTIPETEPIPLQTPRDVFKMMYEDMLEAMNEPDDEDEDDLEDWNTNPLPIYGEVHVRHIADEPIPAQVDYKGYRRVRLSESEMADLYSHLNSNVVQSIALNVNEYLIVENEDGEVVDTLKWNGEELITVKPKKISSNYLGKCAPKDEVQSCAFDSIQENDITVLYGKAGCGKTHIPIAHIMHWLEGPKYNKLYVVFSYEPMRNAKTLGFEKGSHTEKVLMTGSIGNILASKLGDMQMVERMIEDNKLEIVPTANIRGMEFSDKSIVLVTEAQNLDVYTMKTIVQRCADGCKQIYEGDVLEQTDVTLANSGMARLIEVFQGHPKFGCIKLHKGYRSPLCELADQM